MHALIYRRVSTGGQDASLEAQENVNLAYVTAMNWSVRATIADESVSGGIPIAERPGGAELIRALRTCDPADTVIVTANQDRLGRDMPDIVNTVRLIWSLRITPHFPLDGGAFPHSDTNELVLGVKASASNYELNRIRSRTRIVLGDKRERGQLVGQVPFGWDACYTFQDGFEHTSRTALFFGGKRGKSGELGIQPPDPTAAALLAAHGPVVRKELVDNPTEQWWIRHLAEARYPKWPDTTKPTLGAPLRWCVLRLEQSGLKPKFGGAWQIGNVDNLLKNRYTTLLLNGQNPVGTGSTPVPDSPSQP